MYSQFNIFANNVDTDLSRLEADDLDLQFVKEDSTSYIQIQCDKANLSPR